MAKHTAGRKLSTALLLFSPLVLLPYFGCWHAALVQFVQPAILERVTPPRNLNAGKTKYFQVKPKTPIIDVPEIKGHSRFLICSTWAVSPRKPFTCAHPVIPRVGALSGFDLAPVMAHRYRAIPGGGARLCTMLLSAFHQRFANHAKRLPFKS
jgi:hypothetical protein